VWRERKIQHVLHSTYLQDDNYATRLDAKQGSLWLPCCIGGPVGRI
jgi:hypothetical protein